MTHHPERQDRLTGYIDELKAEALQEERTEARTPSEYAGREERRPGHRPRIPKPGYRVSLNLMVTPEIKYRLDAAARASRRTESQEAEHLIELGALFEDFTRDFGCFQAKAQKLLMTHSISEHQCRENMEALSRSLQVRGMPYEEAEAAAARIFAAPQDAWIDRDTRAPTEYDGQIVGMDSLGNIHPTTNLVARSNKSWVVKWLPISPHHPVAR